MSTVSQRPPLPARVYAYVAAVGVLAIALLPVSRLAGRTIGGAPAAIAAAALAAAQHLWALVLLVAPAWLARRALQEVEARYHHIFEHALDGIFQTGPDGRFQAVNPAAAGMLGYTSPQDLIAGAATARQLYADPAQYDAHERLLSATGEVNGVEVEVHPRDGTPRWIVLNARAARTSDRRILRIEGIMTDITSRKQAEQAQEQLLEHEQAARAAAETASRAKEEFISLLSHDLRTPLTTIKASTQLLRRQTRRSEVPMAEVAEGLARIEAGAIRMDRMVGELLDLARLEMGETPDLRLRRTDLTPLLARMVDEHQQLTDEHEILLTPSAPALRGHWDGDRLERVFANLLSNAIKFSPGGGTITVTATTDEDVDGPAWVVVCVRDEGVGIPSADLPHILTRFYRATNVAGQIAGNGIGLSGAVQIVEQHGGGLTIDSTEGMGTVVSVRLPLRAPAAPSPGPSPAGAGEGRFCQSGLP